MIDDATTWNELAALLPEAESADVRDCWAIGEQEAGLDLLVSGLLAHRVPIGEAVRARISVIAEAWGEREQLTPRLLRCHGDGAPADLRLLDDGTDPDDGSADLVLVPWIACTRCGRVLQRAYGRESWGGLGALPHHYAITSPDGATAPRTFPDDAVTTAFAGLLAECVGLPGPADGPSGSVPSHG
ncbi:hypothetical protein ACFW1A_24535 [Kitasatospora sp. NPDC058965]|uniref:hypothetical protein n=1 Tax=Kitasatospora sp. NPDC058965 TaxID=3346682 RepID=UPI0036C97D44